jgi:hypothetical protein
VIYKLERSGRMFSWPILRRFPSICLKYVNKTTTTGDKIVALRDEIRNGPS